MNFLRDGIGDLLLKKLAQAIEVNIAVAFFNPSDSIMSALLALPQLSLIISEEFTVNDPYKIEQLSTARLRSIPTDHEHGKLHAKVIIARLKDGSDWILLGSANLTYQGMFSNQEACIEMRSSNSEDRSAIRSIQQWFHDLFAGAQIPNLAVGKSIFDQRSRYRLAPRPLAQSTEYWALKTTSGGPSGEEHWPKLLAGGVIAIGWEELSVDPSQVSDAQLRTALSRDFDYSKRQIDASAATIRNFINLREGTIIVLCQGYASKQDKPVHIYGFARVTRSFRADHRNGSEWRFKHDAVIQEVSSLLPRNAIASAFKKDSLRQTLHKLTEAGVTQLVKDLGVSIKV
jgi:hypothetical protein